MNKSNDLELRSCSSFLIACMDLCRNEHRIGNSKTICIFSWPPRSKVGRWTQSNIIMTFVKIPPEDTSISSLMRCLA